MKNKIIQKQTIVQVGKLKLFDHIEGNMIIGFSNDGKKVFLQEVGGEGGECSYKDVEAMLK